MSDTVRVSIGNDPQAWLAGELLQFSILSRTTRRVEFTSTWDRKTGWHPVQQRNLDLPMGTPFSCWRWLVPEVYGHEGRAIYCDSDQIVLADIGELFDWPIATPGDVGEPHKPCKFAAVIGAEGDILTKGKPHPDAVQTSVMVYDCAACDWDWSKLAKGVQKGTLAPVDGRGLDPHFAKHKDPKRRAYGCLMQANWIPLREIAPLDPNWNALNVYKPGETKLLHYTVSAQQPWRNAKRNDDCTDIWMDELRSAVRDGYIYADDLRREVETKHVSARVLDVLS